MKERNSSIELLRILLMFGICMIHVVGKGSYSQRWLANLLKICVPGFVFITGYFGVTFSWCKLAKLYAVGAYCALVGAITWASMQTSPVGVVGLYRRWFMDMNWFWFLHSYAVMLMVAPILNSAIEKIKETCVLKAGGGGGQGSNAILSNVFWVGVFERNWACQAICVWRGRL